MKLNFKLLFAGMALPVGMAASFFGTTPEKNIEPMAIAKPYVVDVVATDGSVKEINGVSQEADPFLIAEQLGANPFKEDKFSAFPDIKMGIGSKITIYRAPLYTIVDAKKKTEYRSWAKTVGDLISEAKLPALGVDDKVSFPLSVDLVDKMEIKITRVAKTTVVESEPIKYKTIKKSNPNVEKGNKKTLQAGANGKKDKYYAVTREDGVETSRKLVKTQVTDEPVDEILEIGTKVVVYDSGKATWYIKTSQMLAASNTIPKGTKVHIVNVSNGKSVDCTISGGGIHHDDNVVVDLSTAAFQALGASLGTGKLSNIRVEKFYPPE